MLNLTAPVVTDVTEDPKQGWYKILRVINCVALPMLVVFIYPGGEIDIFPVQFSALPSTTKAHKSQFHFF
jgi:hypothetical protein